MGCTNNPALHLSFIVVIMLIVAASEPVQGMATNERESASEGLGLCAVGNMLT